MCTGLFLLLWGNRMITSNELEPLAEIMNQKNGDLPVNVITFVCT